MKMKKFQNSRNKSKYYMCYIVYSNQFTKLISCRKTPRQEDQIIFADK